MAKHLKGKTTGGWNIQPKRLGIGEAGRVPASTPEDELETARLQPRSKYDYPQGRKLACGCTVFYAAHVMNASMGTSCQDCYDRMSDC